MERKFIFSHLFSYVGAKAHKQLEWGSWGDSDPHSLYGIEKRRNL